MPSRLLLIIYSLGAMLLGSCASISPDSNVLWQSGAARARVVEVYAPGLPNVELPLCLSGLSTVDLATRRFVRIKYRRARHTHMTIAEVPDTLQLAVHDQVEFLPEDCSKGRISRISRRLSTSSSGGLAPDSEVE
jgi:hypothetical protein